MNSNLLQTILTVVTGIVTFATLLLTSFGCHDTGIAGTALDCANSSAPTWLIPYLGTAATALVFLKLIISFFQGKLVAPTAVIATTNEPGTVHPSAVVPPK